MPQTNLLVFAHIGGAAQAQFAPCGQLQLTETERGVDASQFAYGSRYVRRPEAFAIDPVGLPELQGGRYYFPDKGMAQFGAIRDAAPDAWGRRLIEARRKVPANSLLESVYLLEAGSERVGALDVRASLDAPATQGVSSVHALEYMLETVERVELGERVPLRLTDLMGSGPGVGGARPKTSVRDAQGALWLAKFPSVSDTFDVARAEYATLRLAQSCGLNVPQLQVLDLGRKSCLLVRRFDRYSMPDSPVELRLAFASGLSLVGCDEFESRSKSYGDLAHCIRRYGATSSIRRDNAELFGRMVFNIMVSNDDDHLRNHGFLRTPHHSADQGWRLSPLYDVVPRPGVAYERYLHLGVGPQGKLATLDNAFAAHTLFDLEAPAALQILARVTQCVAAWRTHFEDWAMPLALIDSLAPAFRPLADVASVALMGRMQRHLD